MAMAVRARLLAGRPPGIEQDALVTAPGKVKSTKHTEPYEYEDPSP
jgi:hypothetical protein